MFLETQRTDVIYTVVPKQLLDTNTTKDTKDNSPKIKIHYFLPFVPFQNYPTTFEHKIRYSEEG